MRPPKGCIRAAQNYLRFGPWYDTTSASHGDLLIDLFAFRGCYSINCSREKVPSGPGLVYDRRLCRPSCARVGGIRQNLELRVYIYYIADLWQHII